MDKDEAIDTGAQLSASANANASNANTDNGEDGTDDHHGPLKRQKILHDNPNGITTTASSSSSVPAAAAAARKRRWKSVFASNQAFHELVDTIADCDKDDDSANSNNLPQKDSQIDKKIDNSAQLAAVVGKEDQNQDDDDDKGKDKGKDKETIDDSAQLRAPAVGKEGQNQDNDDDDVQIIPSFNIITSTPTSVSSTKASSPQEVEITTSNVTNPTISYPHPRHLCGVHPFSPQHPMTHILTCPQCYCYVCDLPVGQCTSWKEDHCHACGDDDSWMKKRKDQKVKATGGTVNKELNKNGSRNGAESHSNIVDLCGSDSDNDGNDHADSDCNAAAINAQSAFMKFLQSRGVTHNGAPISSSTGASASTSAKAHVRQRLDLEERMYGHHFDRRRKKGDEDLDLIGERERKDCKIVEVFQHNLRQIRDRIVAEQSTASRVGKDTSYEKMDGDIPQLNLHKSFFVEGVRIGWPYPLIMPPQRQMAIHLIKAYKNKRHVVLESPTGTGKSAAILCASLAWQRYDQKTNGFGETTKIIYCSRTHSQVAQMVTSLRKTAYRPRMAILGSRDRMCIHKKIRPRNNGNDNGSRQLNSNIQVSNACLTRVRNTEYFRKEKLKSPNQFYDDNSPEDHMPGDGGDSDIDVDHGDDDEDPRFGSKKFKTCSHYRQLSSLSVAGKVHSSNVPNRNKVNCCSLGGDKTKFGTHDIEDLIGFGMNPNITRNVAIYRGKGISSFGLKLSQPKNKPNGSISVQSLVSGGASESEGTLQEGDVIVKVNGLDVSGGYNLLTVTQKIRESQDPLVIDFYRGTDDEIDNEEYSSEAACPYYISRALSKEADLIFAPYNYVLDPNIRGALGISLDNAIVVLDEAHNVESTLRDMASVKNTEIDLMEMVMLLVKYTKIYNSQNDVAFNPLNQDDTSGNAHEILLFIEKIIAFVQDSRVKFENDQVRNGISKATVEYTKFKCPDDKEFEVSYFGPTGAGVQGEPVGCKSFFEQIDFNTSQAECLSSSMDIFQKTVLGERNGDSEDSERNSVVIDSLTTLVKSFCEAIRLPEHFYVSTVVSANGNLEFATTGVDPGGRYRKKPKQNPIYPTPTNLNPKPINQPCHHFSCNITNPGAKCHGEYCDGKIKKWHGKIVLNLLTPGLRMSALAGQCRSVVLASGSLAPIPSLCAELNLLPPNLEDQRSSKADSLGEEKKKIVDPLSEKFGRLQVTPRPLEANHVVKLPKQLLALSIGHFPDGSPLSVKMANYSRPGFHEKLGQGIATIIDSIPKGGVLVFFPSFSFLRKCESLWRFSNVWNRFLAAKGKVVVEPSGSSQPAFEIARDDYNDEIKETGECILLAVFRGKMSEGISFNDEFARGVICVGIPYPSSYERTIKAKMAYNDEQRKMRKKKLLSGQEWYAQQAYRAIAQALGRCIRHAADYGTIVLLDNRHCDDGSYYNNAGICQAHAKLPKWMRHSVRNLRLDRIDHGRNEILGGWKGLELEMARFFHEAKVCGEEVLLKQTQAYKKVQDRNLQSTSLSFKNGKWSRSDAKADAKKSGSEHQGKDLISTPQDRNETVKK